MQRLHGRSESVGRGVAPRKGACAIGVTAALVLAAAPACANVGGVLFLPHGFGYPWTFILNLVVVLVECAALVWITRLSWGACLGLAVFANLLTFGLGLLPLLRFAILFPLTVALGCAIEAGLAALVIRFWGGGRAAGARGPWSVARWVFALNVLTIPLPFLLAIAVPNTRDNTTFVECTRALQTISRALAVYSTDHEGRVPTVDSGAALLRALAEQPGFTWEDFTCPGDNGDYWSMKPFERKHLSYELVTPLPQPLFEAPYAEQYGYAPSHVRVHYASPPGLSADHILLADTGPWHLQHGFYYTIWDDVLGRNCLLLGGEVKWFAEEDFQRAAGAQRNASDSRKEAADAD